ncbi:MAG: sigma-70 family RNA polymerase sigma factor [Planctomycetes bacterium]|nr:sigma-70 family RNA polymerase sigma factor [Planctomycetota bacterium]
MQNPLNILRSRKALDKAEPIACCVQEGGIDCTDIDLLLREFETPLLRYVQKVLGRGASEGEDIVQETFIRFCSQLANKGRDSLANPASWLFRVARNLCMDHGRHQSVLNGAREQVRAEQKEEGLVDEGAEEILHREACSVALEELGRLPELEREVLSLKFIGELKLREIGHVTGLSTSTADYRLNRGLEILRKKLKERGIF